MELRGKDSNSSEIICLGRLSQKQYGRSSIYTASVRLKATSSLLIALRFTIHSSVPSLIQYQIPCLIVKLLAILQEPQPFIDMDKFANLPPELRYIIWDLALQQEARDRLIVVCRIGSPRFFLSSIMQVPFSQSVVRAVI